MSKYSIFVPLYNAESYLPELLPLLKRIESLPLFEVVFVDSSSVDSTVLKIKEFGFVSVFNRYKY